MMAVYRAIRGFIVAGSFDVIEFWVENHVMLELMTKEMSQGYLRTTETFRPHTVFGQNAPKISRS